MENFNYKKIKELRIKNKMSQKLLGEYMGISDRAVSKWESGQCCPDIQLLPTLASYFSVSIDYLMGIEQAPVEPSLTSTTEPVENPILTKARKLRAENGKLSTSLLQRKLQVSYPRAKKNSGGPERPRSHISASFQYKNMS